MSSANANESKRFYPELSFIRALACLCIVMVHVTAGYYYENDRTFNWLTQFLNQISRYGTPAFAIISGFLLYNHTIKKGFNFKKFVKSRFTKVVSPFFVWSIIYLVLKWNYDKLTLDFKSIEGVKEFVYFFLTGKSNYHLYFIIIVVQFYIIFPFIQLFKSKKSLLLITLINLFINYFFVNFNIDLGSGYFNQFINERVFLFQWVYYFFIGGLMVYYWEKLTIWIKQNNTFSLLLGLVIIVGGVFEYHFSGWIESNRSMNMITLPVLFISLTALYNILSPWNKIRDYIIGIGNLSMGIYLVHPFILFFLRNYDFFTPLYNSTKYLPFVYCITLILSILIVKVVDKMPLGSYIVTVAKPQQKVKEEVTQSLLKKVGT